MLTPEAGPTTRCVTPRRPQQHPYAHFSTTGHVFTAEESFHAITRRPGALVALRAAAGGREIANSSPTRKWYSADTRLLRIHGLLRKVGRRLDTSARLVITEEGRDVLFLFGTLA